MNRFTKVNNTGEPISDDAEKWDAVLDNTTGLMWSAGGVGKPVPQAKAEEAVSNLTLCGLADWRLPSVEELFLLADRSRFKPAIDTSVFPTCKSDWYWTASPDASDPAYAWSVSFFYGNANLDNRDDHGFVRAVRSVSSAPASQ